MRISAAIVGLALLGGRAPAEEEVAPHRRPKQRSVSRQVTYLLGRRDTDPDHPALDRSCTAEAQGPTRYARGHAYAAVMAARNDGTSNHRVVDVPDVGRDGDAMLTSPCGLAALCDLFGCDATR